MFLVVPFDFIDFCFNVPFHTSVKLQWFHCKPFSYIIVFFIKILYEIGAFVMDAPMPMMTGQVADAPTDSELCQGYASFIQNPGIFLTISTL